MADPYIIAQAIWQGLAPTGHVLPPDGASSGDDVVELCVVSVAVAMHTSLWLHVCPTEIGARSSTVGGTFVTTLASLEALCPKASVAVTRTRYSCGAG
jgi:hypothetical protein